MKEIKEQQRGIELKNKLMFGDEQLIHREYCQYRWRYN